MNDAVQEALEGLRPTGDGGWTAYRSVLAALTPEALANEIYWALHCRVPCDTTARTAPDTWGERAAFVEQLSRANTGVGPWQAGWTLVARVNARRCFVRAFDVTFLADVRHVRRDVRAGPGARGRGVDVTVRVPAEYRHLSAGYYMALGDTDHQPTTGPTIRLYWNVAPEGAAALVAELTDRLNAAGIPFRYKTPADPDRFQRSDTGVLYLPAEAYRRALPHVARVHCAVLPHLRADLSAFVKAIAHGLGAAFDPGDGSSFGAHRAALLAAAIISVMAPAEGHGKTSARRNPLHDALRGVRAALDRRGYDPRRLYLAPGRTDTLTPLAPSPGALRRGLRAAGRRPRHP